MEPNCQRCRHLLSAAMDGETNVSISGSCGVARSFADRAFFYVRLLPC